MVAVLPPHCVHRADGRTGGVTVADKYILSVPGGDTMNRSPPRSVMVCGCSSAYINAARMFASSGMTCIVGLRDRCSLLANRPPTRGHVRNRKALCNSSALQPCDGQERACRRRLAARAQVG